MDLMEIWRFGFCWGRDFSLADGKVFCWNMSDMNTNIYVVHLCLRG